MLKPQRSETAEGHAEGLRLDRLTENSPVMRQQHQNGCALAWSLKLWAVVHKHLTGAKRTFDY